jgi:cytochrome c oxidase subunit 3
MSLNLRKKNNQRHPFHLVDPSPWPFVGAISAFSLAFGFVMYMHSYTGGWFLFILGFFSVVSTMILWWRDVIREATFEGQHTSAVQAGIKTGIILFIVSEVMFFFAFFWAFFHASINPSPNIGGVWPPQGIETLNPWGIPLLNTVILLSSGASVTWSHHAVIAGKKGTALETLLITILLAICFTALQGYEYVNAPFSISDGIYGSTFFMGTGFHGLHVFIGTIFLIVCFFRIYLNHFSKQHHIGFEGAIYYWHFVDIVWLFLFISIYWWGS